jgi:hypothetical protein
VGARRRRRAGAARRVPEPPDEEGRQRRGQPRQAHAREGLVQGDDEVGPQGRVPRRGKARLPIQELRGSRPVDALLHKGEADGVAARGGKSFGETFTRVLPLEIGK